MRIFFTGSMAVMKSLVISLALIIINVYVNWFISFELTKHQLLDTNIISVQMFRVVIALCQISGSLLCLALVDFIERKVNKNNLRLKDSWKFNKISILQYLLLVSISSITVVLIIFEVFGINSGNGSWLPILLIAIAAFSLHCGVFPLTFILVPEIVPERVIESLVLVHEQALQQWLHFQIRIYAVTFVFTFMWALMFLISQIESPLIHWLTHADSLNFVVFIVFNLICTVLFWIYIPPTKRKSYGEIFSRLNYGLSL